MVPWKIVELTVMPEFRLRLVFADGLEGVVDFSEFVASDLAGTVFEPLREESFFRQAYLDPTWGAVSWPGDLDMAPDAMHTDIAKAQGEFCVPPVLRKVA